MLSKELLDQGRIYARKIIDGLNASPSHFHAVNYCKKQLSQNGFTELKETDKWTLEPSKGYYFSRNGSTIVAFLTGALCGSQPVSSYKIVGCHTDSPVLKIAPYSKISASGYNQLNVMLYGGGLWRTWFDRDLNIAGKVIVKSIDGTKLESRYWNANRPLLKIPNLAIHLCREEQPLSKETETKPIFASSVADSLFSGGVEAISEDKFRIDEKHFSTFTELIAKDLGIVRDQIVDFELNICDAQPAQLVGMHEEFVSSPRLDNLASSLCALDALI